MLFLPRFTALRQVRSAMLFCLLLLLTACSSLTPPAKLNPPPPNLVTLCDEGPLPPAGDQALSVVIHTVRAREKAAAECRLRHRDLVRWIDTQLK
jgi:hypothetical protein